MIYGFFIWLMCGIGSAIVASNKGRSAFGWFVLGFFLGPIGFILSLVVAKNQVAIEESILKDGEMRKCPFCAELIKTEAILCKHCGKELPVAPIPYNEPKKHQLIKATADGNWVLAMGLIERGEVEINELSDEGETSFDIAVKRKDKLLIDLLAQHGGKPSNEITA